MESLNKRLYNGDPEAFVELYDQLADRLFRYVAVRVRNQQDASDIIQEIFIRLVKSHRSLAKADNLTAYLFQVARTEMIRWQKKQAFPKALQSPISDQNIPTELHCQNRFEEDMESWEWIQQILSGLEPIDLEIVQLKIFSGLTFREVAEMMQLQLAHVATRYRRALATIETQIERNNMSQERTP